MSQLGPVPGHPNGVTGALIKAKRKVEPEGDVLLESAAQARRTESIEPDSSDSAEESDGDDDGNDEDAIPADGGYVTQSFFVDDEAVSAPSLHPSYAQSKSIPRLPASQFSRSPQVPSPSTTACTPLLSPPRRPSRLTIWLASRLVKRVPVTSHPFHLAKPQNLASFLMQAVGDEVPRHNWCGCCNRGNDQEPCVVVRDEEVLAITGGACANCWFNRLGSLCSFRRPTPTARLKQQAGRTAQKGKGQETPAPVPEIPLMSQTAQLDSMPVPAPIHPAYAAALASGEMEAAPTAAPTTAADGSHRGNMSQSWQDVYGAMSVGDLIQAHRELVKWQAEVNTELMAMNSVLLQRLRHMKRESPGCRGSEISSESARRSGIRQ
ncbi:hypothetical protein VTI74DRAFT_4068 [Chaetomium olivicolor]